MDRICTFEGCGRHLSAKGLCQTHYWQQRRGEELRPIVGKGGRQRTLDTCKEASCERRAVSRDMCEAHYRQHLRGTELRELYRSRERKPCAFDSCDRQADSKGLCDAHHQQQFRGIPLRPIRVPAFRYTAAGGYVLVKDPDHPNAQKNGLILEHVKVMSDHLGRMLWPDENVHHKNGKRDDNRLENLELWSTSQPKGQRIEDKVEFAIEMLQRYAPERLRET